MSSDHRSFASVVLFFSSRDLLSSSSTSSSYNCKPKRGILFIVKQQQGTSVFSFKQQQQV
uniref:Uncharacterized protein n=1 Tax=Arundo donax TaxID=35708 RepID=A0A0A9BGY6_ARUDO